MYKPLATAVLLLFASFACSQPAVLLFKKGERTIARYWPGSIIAFETQNGQWQKGEIARLQHDSIYIQPRLVQYHLMGTDTIHFPIAGFSLTDIHALPKKGVRVDYINGSFRPTISGSRVKWYWIKSGWIFRVGGMGYAGLNIANGIIKNDLSLANSKDDLAIAAGLFAVGTVLHKLYRPAWRIRHKYHLQMLTLAE